MIRIIFRTLFSLFLSGLFAVTLWLVFSDLYKNLILPDFQVNFVEGRDAELHPNASITQTFRATKDGLARINLTVNNLSDLKKDETIHIELQDAPCQQTLAEESLDQTFRSPERFHHFDFSPLTQSRDKQYCLRATFLTNYDYKKKREEVEAEGKEYKENLPNISAHKNLVYTNETYANTGEERLRDWSLSISPAYTSGNFSDDVMTLIDRVSQYKPPFFKGTSLLLIAVFFIGGSILFVFALVLTPFSSQKKLKNK